MKLLPILFQFLIVLPFCVQAQNIIVDYHFDGNLIDSSSNANHFIGFGSGPTYTYTAGRSTRSNDRSILFNNGRAVESAMSINNSSWSGTSIAVWVKGSGVGTFYQGLISGGGLTVENTGIIYAFFSGSSGNAVRSVTKINDNNWHFIVAQTDGSTSYMYIDGVLDASKSENMNKMSGPNSTAKIISGGTKLGFSKLSGYQIDRLMLFDDTLSQVIIDSLKSSIKIPCTCIDTVLKTDTIFVHDTLKLIDTVKLTDTLYIHDTLRLTDTLYIHDTIRLNDTIIIHDTIKVKVGTGEYEDHNLQLKIYPNPSNKYVKITGELNGNKPIMVTAQGESVENYNLVRQIESEIILDISQLSNGTYIVLIGSHQIRFVKTD